MKKTLVLFLLIGTVSVISGQEEDAKEKAEALRTSTNYTWDGNKNLSEDNFIQAEVDYRKAIAISPDNAAAPYNLGNAYYNNETYSEAFGRFKEAGETATTKLEKHKAYHNMGNVFMKRKEYAKAVEAYKEALRNNPKDEETRYNLALAQEMLKKEQDENKDNKDDKKDQQDKEDKKDQDQNKDGDNKNDENQDKKDQGEDGDKENKGDKGEEKKDENKEGEDGDKENKGDKGEEKKDENKEGEGDEKNEQNKKPEQGDQPQQPKPNQLSKQQVENLLRAMQNAEKKVQDKIDAKKVKGAKVQNEKDW